jgi:hypothetical protein
MRFGQRNQPIQALATNFCSCSQTVEISVRVPGPAQVAAPLGIGNGMDPLARADPAAASDDAATLAAVRTILLASPLD